MTLRCIYFFVLCLYSIPFNAQSDTSYLNYDQLRWTDIKSSDSKELSTKVVAGTRTERDLEDLPFTVFVITAEEIREQGYFTLVDALKHLPGIRVSQPGSGLDGETFIMRGLYGNSYAKILINDIPIKPSVVGAMPIGSQLPIRQAERIEVIYGPAATLYGTDAASGVINIIIKDSEYPTYAQADIETGLQNLTRLNAMFGGKFALGKKVLKLKMYGGFTAFTDRRVKYDLDNLYNPEVYDSINLANLDPQGQIRYDERPNYRGSKTKPFLANLPHQSNYIGFSASIGIFEFHTQRLFRADHSSVGLNPFAVSYANPLSQIGEEILTTTLTFKKKLPRWDYNVKLTNLTYSINPLSSYNYVLPTFGLVTNLYFQNNVQPNSNVDGPALIDSLYLSGPRYVKNSTTDVSVEAQFNFKINDWFSLSTGFLSLSGFGDAIQRFRALPGSVPDRIIQTPTLPTPDALFADGTLFAEAYLNLGSFQAIGGAQVFLRADSLVNNELQFNPRIGLLYRLTPKFSVRASYSSAFRYPTAFFSGSTYQVKTKDDVIDVITGTENIEPERTISFETGIRFTLDPSIYIDASFYFTRTKNYLNYDFAMGEEQGSILWGYQNDPDSFNRLFGAQLSLKVKNIWPALNMDTDLSLNFSRGKERILEIFLINQDASQLQDIPVIRGQPDFMGHLRLSFDAGRYFRIHLNNSFMTKSWTRNIFRVSAALAQNKRESLQNNGYYTLDFRTVFKISRQLSAYFNISNLFNVQYAGIDASFDPDVLLYNPQSLRTAKLGVNFAFN